MRTSKLRTASRNSVAVLATSALIATLGLLLWHAPGAGATGGYFDVNPTEARAGDTIEVSGYDFLPGETVEIGLGGIATVATTDADGEFKADIEVPESMPPGDHPLDVSGATVDLTVLPPEVTAPASEGPLPSPPSSAPDGRPAPAPPELVGTGAGTETSPMGTDSLGYEWSVLIGAALVGGGLLALYFLGRRPEGEPGKHAGIQDGHPVELAASARPRVRGIAPTTYFDPGAGNVSR